MYKMLKINAETNAKNCIHNTREDVIVPIIMNCRVSTPEALEFKIRLGFNPHDLIMAKEQSVLTKIMKVFASEEILL